MRASSTRSIGPFRKPPTSLPVVRVVRVFDVMQGATNVPLRNRARPSGDRDPAQSERRWSLVILAGFGISPSGGPNRRINPWEPTHETGGTTVAKTMMAASSRREAPAASPVVRSSSFSKSPGPWRCQRACPHCKVNKVNILTLVDFIFSITTPGVSRGHHRHVVAVLVVLVAVGALEGRLLVPANEEHDRNHRHHEIPEQPPAREQPDLTEDEARRPRGTSGCARSGTAPRRRGAASARVAQACRRPYANRANEMSRNAMPGRMSAAPRAR